MKLAFMIASPEKPDWTEHDPALASVAGQLAEADGPVDDGLKWPEQLWSLLENAGATRWSLPEEFGGDELPAAPSGSALCSARGWKPDGGLHPVAA